MGVKLITLDDLIDVYSKARQRGTKFILSKFNWSGQSRTKSAFNESAIESSNWWIIPKVRERWNLLISGDANVNYEAFMMREYFSDHHGLKLISLGSGTCTHEIELAKYPNFAEITCLDIAENRLNEARKVAESKGLHQMKFVSGSIYDYDFKGEHYDIILFNASLHHFKNIPKLIEETLMKTLKPGGKLVINEYVGPDRLQFPSYQLQAINHSLKEIPEAFRTRFKLNLKKAHFFGSGWLRMYLADPSECVDSSSILPSIHKNFNIIVEKPYGGNLLMNVLKDISHHFVSDSRSANDILQKLFENEDAYLLHHPSDFIFGIYEKPIK